MIHTVSTVLMRARFSHCRLPLPVDGLFFCACLHAYLPACLHVHFLAAYASAAHSSVQMCLSFHAVWAELLDYLVCRSMSSFLMYGKYQL